MGMKRQIEHEKVSHSISKHLKVCPKKLTSPSYFSKHFSVFRYQAKHFFSFLLYYLKYHHTYLVWFDFVRLDSRKMKFFGSHFILCIYF